MYGHKNGFARGCLIEYDDGPVPGNILELGKTAYHSLLENGELLVTEEDIEGGVNDDGLEAGLNLIFYDECDGDDDYNPYYDDDSITIWLKKMLLGNAILQPEPFLTLLDQQSLFKLLPQHSEAFLAEIPKLSDMLADPKKFDPIRLPSTTEKVIAKDYFDGMIYLCGENSDYPCYEPGCSSDFAFIKDSVCLIYLYTCSFEIRRANIYPFKTS